MLGFSAHAWKVQQSKDRAAGAGAPRNRISGQGGGSVRCLRIALVRAYRPEKGVELLRLVHGVYSILARKAVTRVMLLCTPHVRGSQHKNATMDAMSRRSRG